MDNAAFACDVNYMSYMLLCIVLIPVFVCLVINVAFPINITVVYSSV